MPTVAQEITHIIVEYARAVLMLIGTLILISVVFYLLLEFLTINFFGRHPSFDAKKASAKQQCDTIAQAIQKYHSLEGEMVEKLMDLKGKYLTGIDTLKDPWGNSIQLDPIGGYVYSKGPDGRDNILASHPANRDNIRVPYIGALAIYQARLEVNPTGEPDPFLARDVLHLVFNKKLRIRRMEFSFNRSSVDRTSQCLEPYDTLVAGKSADPAAKQFSFRWCAGHRTKYIDGSAILRQPSADGRPGEGEADTHKILCDQVFKLPAVTGSNTFISLQEQDPWGHPYILDPRNGVIASAGTDGFYDQRQADSPDNSDNILFPLPRDSQWPETSPIPTGFWPGTIPPGLSGTVDHPPETMDGVLFITEDQRETVIVLPAGTSGSLIPGTHYINLTGNRKNTPFDQGQIFCEMDGITPAEMSGTPVRIEAYE